MSPLEIDTATPFYNVMEEDKQPLYGTTNMVQSPIFTDDESRRSSYYSYSDDKHKSLPSNHYELLYPTKKSAYDRIEYLEEKMKYQKDMNQNVVQQMTQSIDDFLSSRKPIIDNDGTTNIRPSSSLFNLDIFNDFIHVVFNPSKMVEFIESNSFSVTDDKMTKQEFGNVLVDTITTEKDRFVQSMLEEKQELEQVVDEMQREMESMINELDQLKQIDDMGDDITAMKQLLLESTESLRAMELSNLELKKTLHKVNTTFEQQVDALKREKEELRSRLIKAEHAASNQHQKLQENTELEKVLQRTVAQKDAEAAKITHDLDKLQKQYQQLKEMNEKRFQQQVKARLDDLESNLKMQYKKDHDLFVLQMSRDTRELAGQITELETDIENSDRQHQQDLQLLDHIKKQYQALTKTIQQKEVLWEKKETELKQIILNYDQKLISLEKEVLVLYTKNIELVESLGELES